MKTPPSYQGYGKSFKRLNLKKPLFWKFQYPIRATPTWLKAGGISGGLRGYENYKRHE